MTASAPQANETPGAGATQAAIGQEWSTARIDAGGLRPDGAHLAAGASRTTFWLQAPPGRPDRDRHLLGGAAAIFRP